MSGRTEADIRAALSTRWREPVSARGGDLHKLLAVSVGLGDLFDDDEKAERAWMRTCRPDLDGWAPLDLIRTPDGIDRLLSAVNAARNLT